MAKSSIGGGGGSVIFGGVFQVQKDVAVGHRVGCDADERFTVEVSVRLQGDDQVKWLHRRANRRCRIRVSIRAEQSGWTLTLFGRSHRPLRRLDQDRKRRQL